jgi:hypothetical protein
MKKLISLLIGCSLGLAVTALAQQPDEQQQPSKGKHAPQKAHAAQAQPGANPAKAQEKPGRQPGALKERGATNERTTPNQPGAERGQKVHAGHESGNARETNAPAGSTSETAHEPSAEKGRKGHAHQEAATGTDTSGRAAGLPTRRGEQQAERKQGQGVKQPMTETGGTSAAGQQNAQANVGGKVKKPAPQQVQQVKSQRANFKAQPKPQQVPSVTFNQNYRIEGSNNWQGAQYQVFRSYQPQWHDQGWYHSHYNNVVLIGGGYYFFNNGYWFPAWGYSASAQYYPYDGPIYAGHGAEPPDKVIAQTQDLLQQMGYYKGEVDGLLGPLTREALAAYQADQGLTQTAVIDEPTLDSLGLA